MSQEPARETQSVQALERGLAVLQVFDREHPALTLSEVARLADVTRATARRILLTLERLGHVKSDGRQFSLTPRVLSLGWAYLSSLDLWDLAQPLMRELTAQVGESTSAATLDGTDVVYVARVPTQRIMSITIQVGTRLPAHATSMGRVLLAGLEPDELTAFFDAADMQAFTERTIVDPDRLRRTLAEVREQGWAFVDQELERGVRSIAAPIRDSDGRVLAALNVGASASRMPAEQLKGRPLDLLVETARAISDAMARSAPNRLDFVTPAG